MDRYQKFCAKFLYCRSLAGTLDNQAAAESLGQKGLADNGQEKDDVCLPGMWL